MTNQRSVNISISVGRIASFTSAATREERHGEHGDASCWQCRQGNGIFGIRVSRTFSERVTRSSFFKLGTLVRGDDRR